VHPLKYPFVELPFYITAVHALPPAYTPIRAVRGHIGGYVVLVFLLFTSAGVHGCIVFAPPSYICIYSLLRNLDGAGYENDETEEGKKVNDRHITPCTDLGYMPVPEPYSNRAVEPNLICGAA